MYMSFQTLTQLAEFLDFFRFDVAQKFERLFLEALALPATSHFLDIVTRMTTVMAETRKSIADRLSSDNKMKSYT